MEKERFIERILETENLTDELEDADANWLLDWGIQNLDEVLSSTEDEETAGNKVNALMAVMRKINHIAGSYASKDRGELANDLAELNELYSMALLSATFQETVKSAAAFDEVALNLTQMPVRQVLEHLTKRPAGSR